MLKCRGKHVCRRICAKSVRLLLEPYSRYLVSRGYSTSTREVYVRAVEYFGRWLGRRRVGSPGAAEEKRREKHGHAEQATRRDPSSTIAYQQLGLADSILAAQDMGGSLSTTEMTDAIIAALP